VDALEAVGEGLKDPEVNPARVPAGSASTVGAAGAPSAPSVGSADTSKGKHPVEPISLARRSKRLEGVRRQYVVAELFPSIYQRYCPEKE